MPPASPTLDQRRTRPHFRRNSAKRASRETRKHLHNVFVIALFLLATSSPTSIAAQTQTQTKTQPHKLSSDRIKTLTAAIIKFTTDNKVPGLSVAVIERGEFVWSQGFGFANINDHPAATPQTLFRLASVSKPLTATAAMQLYERGKLDLDAPIQKYCPSFPEKSATITTRELLGHLGGIRHYHSDALDDPEISNTKHFDDPIAGGLHFFANDPLVSPPGAHFNYTTHGYTLVGCVIEGASKQKYVDYMRENIFVPAGMTATQPDDNTKSIAGRASFYAKDASGNIVPAAPLDSSYKIPGGGWLSSADDMVRFELAILRVKLISAATTKLMWAAQKPTDGSADDYGLGWGLETKDGLFTVSHDGGQQGTSTCIIISPMKGDGIVVLANIEDVDAAALATELLKTLIATEPDRQPPMIEH